MEENKEWKERKVSLGNAIIIGAVLAVVGVVVGANWKNWFGGFMPYLGFSSNYSSDVDWSPLDEVYSKLASSYDGEISKDAVIDGAKKGLTEALGDKYTVYMDAEEAAEFTDDLHGNVGAGIGVEMGLRDGYVRVLRTLPDNPAREAGILAGDILYKVNGEEVYNLESEEIAKKVRGEAGTEVEVTVVRDGEEKTFKLKREEINNVSAYVDYDGKTAIVTVTRFDNDTGTMVQGFADKFKEKGINKVILDLRGNGGGYVAAAKDLLGLWIDGDVILKQKSLHYGDTEEKTSSGKAILKDMKTIVLVNGTTASSSEIVAGALQDYGKATVVGEKTYGKGSVQELQTLPSGGKYKLTTKTWLTSKGKTVDKKGINPDVEVSLDEKYLDDPKDENDNQLEKAIMEVIK